MCPIVINSPITSSNGEIGINNDNQRAKDMKVKEINFDGESNFRAVS